MASNVQPVFVSVGQALHVSFLMAVMPAVCKSPTQMVIEDLVKENHVWDGVDPPRYSGVNFSGLSPLEVRAQCALVVGAVERIQHPAERAAVKAIYGYQCIKADGVRVLADYVSPQLSMSSSAVLAVAWHVFATKRQAKDITLAAIRKEYGVEPQALRWAKEKIMVQGRALHSRAAGYLEARFSEMGLIEA